MHEEREREAAEHQAFVNHADAPACTECGSITVRNGACYKCPNCGATAHGNFCSSCGASLSGIADETTLTLSAVEAAEDGDDLAHYLDDPYGGPGFTRDPLNDEVDILVVGGGFGGKMELRPWDFAAAWMARETGRPVKFTLNRAEELTREGLERDPEDRVGALGHFLLADVLNRRGKLSEAAAADSLGLDDFLAGGRDFERTQLSEITLTLHDETLVSQTAAMARKYISVLPEPVPVVRTTLLPAAEASRADA